MITQATAQDTDELMAIWWETTQVAHPFIDASYWQTHGDAVKNIYLPAAKTWVYRQDDRILGFISVLENHFIGALFVLPHVQRQGIGRQLLAHCQSQYDSLALSVYKENHQAVNFYQKHHFVAKDSSLQAETGQIEIAMLWETCCGKNNT